MDSNRAVKDSNPKSQQSSDKKSIQACGHVVEDDSPAFGQLFKLTNGEGLGDIEEAEEKERDESVEPGGRKEEECDPLACDFINDDKLRIFFSTFACRDGSGWNSEEQ
jgi:hypothetical protein